MIIKDNFVTNPSLLKELRLEAKAFSSGYADGIKDTFWKNFNTEAVNTCEKFCQIIFEEFCQTSEYQGFEYWVNYLIPCEEDALDWHSDKDEYLARTTGRIVCPTLGMVYYLHEEDPEGGYLDISTEAEKIEAPPNRFVLFNPSAPHRVTATKKPRLTLAANIWKKAPSKENFSGKKLIRK